MKNKNVSKWLFLGSIVFALLPIASLVLSFLLSNLLNCSTAYAGEESCKIGGQFVGDVVYSMFTFGWFMIYTIPLGLIGIVIATIMFGLRKAKNKQTPKT